MVYALKFPGNFHWLLIVAHFDRKLIPVSTPQWGFNFLCFHLKLDVRNNLNEGGPNSANI